MSRLLCAARKHKTATLVALSYSAVSGGAFGSVLLISRVLATSYGVR
jgi:hypothetical protein